ncbi:MULTISPECIES: arginine--tRNA ligase [Parafrankia]|uniref:Arginine--tRNA ligase n=1 Tax=Parafrankia soli TaxID=2599596 RepID=A0A1S1RMA8_9ACTN|nr:MULTISPECIES: arginine--tRNA ligase [Parafrankia]OHV46951.1 arginine--tRNA ligase [Parafrankia soli]TCJ40276.1 arginine--tRNA ligase [Parafrankia sp. BMG5.11]CAI7976381.1 Arginine--tRNA ligase [Frankia sp. Hr75.2]SQD96027.1 Arginine--tRNA ligase [Parafrankia sp. Ea1.12]
MTPAELADTIVAAVRAAVANGDLEVAVPDSVTVERPRQPEHGDYASPVALQLAKAARRRPREVAELLAARLRAEAGVAEVEVAGPGFLNIRLAGAALGGIARRIVRDGESYGRAAVSQGVRVNLEFVSANPTGPVTLASARWAAVGDALSRVFAAAGYEVGTEYYVNDAGVQVERFGASVLAALRGQPAPADGYQGAYVAEIAAKVLAANPALEQLLAASGGEQDGGAEQDKALAVCARDGVELMLAEIRATLSGFGVEYDLWKSERSLHEAGELTAAIDELRTQGHVYEADGAVWLRTTDFGDDKDRALIKRDGQPTYFCADAAYYRDKRRRGFDRLCYLLGADHHGYIGRLKAISACFGDDPDHNLDVLIGQMVTLSRGGVAVKMSKRAGNFLTLHDLVDAVGVDAARYSLVRASMDSALDLDLDAIARQTNDNPVFYVQYAHARISSLIRNAAALGLATSADPAFDVDGVDVSLLTHPREVDLLGALGELPRVVASAAELRAPHRIARYLEELAGTYHRFYDSCRVLPQGDEEPTAITAARLLLAEATRTVLANGLRLLGVSAPERM